MTVQRDPIFGCELVTSRLDHCGYAYHGSSRAHIVAYVAKRGVIPSGLVLDHCCRRRNCKAVHHLEAVTQQENERRKDWRYVLKRERCQAGHELRLYRQILPTRGVVCRRCNELAGAI